MVRPTFTDSNPELKYYPFSITLDKCNGSFNVLSLKIWVPKETKDINAKAFNMIANKNEAKTIAKHTYVLLDANSIVPYVIQIKNGIMKHVRVHVKIIVSAKKIIVGILEHAFVRIKYCWYFSDRVGWNYMLWICINKNDGSNKYYSKYYSNKCSKKNFHNKKARYKIDYYILHTVLLVIILLLIITVICSYYAKHRSKQEIINTLTI